MREDTKSEGYRDIWRKGERRQTQPPSAKFLDY